MLDKYTTLQNGEGTAADMSANRNEIKEICDKHTLNINILCDTQKSLFKYFTRTDAKEKRMCYCLSPWSVSDPANKKKADAPPFNDSGLYLRINDMQPFEASTEDNPVFMEGGDNVRFNAHHSGGSVNCEWVDNTKVTYTLSRKGVETKLNTSITLNTPKDHPNTVNNIKKGVRKKIGDLKKGKEAEKFEIKIAGKDKGFF